MKTRFQISIQPTPFDRLLFRQENARIDAIAVEEVNLARRSARARVAHRPEVVFFAETAHLRVTKAGELFPEVARERVFGDAVFTFEVGEDHALGRQARDSLLKKSQANTIASSLK